MTEGEGGRRSCQFLIVTLPHYTLAQLPKASCAERNGCVGICGLEPLGTDKVGPSGQPEDSLRCPLTTQLERQSPCRTDPGRLDQVTELGISRAFPAPIAYDFAVGWGAVWWSQKRKFATPGSPVRVCSALSSVNAFGKREMADGC
ncbi:unnamed protein product [Rangifer tarandus platyrhynchus]|uniref:Uncharacterized protein n=1 Tax=Rangifer tarandus platyrhynchus TaxID=3082113 RepID=A0ABN8Z752_RANTA|nr:unnamed protein product [Rangifer tarandus platyrhynchus]